ncbi:MAG: ABC transporter ATP-binding protein [Lysobacterales bacterium]
MPTTAAPLLELRQLRKRFGAVEALAGLDLAVHAGEVLALLGPNGAGKTTAVRAALGLLRLDGGSVQLLGADPRTLAARLGLGVMLQVGALPDTLSVREQLRVAASYHAMPESLDTLVQDCGLADLLDRRYGQLSGGQKRRAQFALALVGRPRLLILDEPTTALDPLTRQQFWTTIRTRVAQGLGVLLTTHDLVEADAVAHRVAVVAAGRLLGSGSPATVRARMEGSVLRCRSQLDPGWVAALPEVASCEHDAQRLRIRTHAPEALLRRLLAADATLDELELTRPTLEDAVTAWLKEAA